MSRQGLLFSCYRLIRKKFPFPASCGRMERENPYIQFLGQRRRGIPGVCSRETSSHFIFTVEHPSTLHCAPVTKSIAFQRTDSCSVLLVRGISGIILFSRVWRRGPARFQLPCIQSSSSSFQSLPTLFPWYLQS